MRGTRHRLPIRTGVLALVLLAHASPGLTQELDTSVDLQQFRPGVGVGDILGVESGRVADRLVLRAGLYLNVLDDALVLRDQHGDEVGKLVDSQTSADLLVAVGMGQRIQVSLALPVVLTQATGGPPGMEAFDGGAGFGDLRLTPKTHVLTRAGLSVAASMAVILPTGAGGAFRSQKSVGVHPSVAADYALPRVQLAANAGLRLREGRQLVDIDNGNELTYGLGARVPIGATDLAGLATLTGALGLRDLGAVESPLELLVGVQYLGIEDLELVAGLGPGLTRGYGSPDVRLFAGIVYRPGGSAPARPTCDSGPEDYDRFEDDDGCADLDNDGDGIPDLTDRCPNEPEDFDGDRDEDGCPEEDEPAAVEPPPPVDPDPDGDGLVGDADRCPTEPEDVDGFEDDDGCPDLDNDGDGIADVDDACPLEAEVFNGVDDTDGCPDQARTIAVTEQIQFDTGKATIRRESFPALDSVVKVLNDEPRITQIRIEGHTDDRGSPERNDALSQRRAQAVAVYLISKGISARRLSARGYGQAQPLVPNDSPENRAQNRRVEFVIVEVDGVAVEPPR